MCGIAGILSTDGTPVPAGALVGMLDRLEHRGPDGRGTFVSGAVALGHTRLAILDLETGAQPLGNEDGTVQVTFNGEIYNHHVLAEGLAGEHTFRTRTDTEVLVHLYEEHGPALVDRLDGFFAFALWDEPRQRLVLARDRLGKKPLFVGRAGGRLYFASELRALLAAWPGKRELDPEALADVLALRYVSGARSGLLGIERLLPGEVRVVDGGREESRRYWHVPAPAPVAMDLDEAASSFRERLDASVAARLESDVPLGLLLSGGLDSTAVLESMARVAPFPVRSFTLSFSRAKESEAGSARLAANHFGTEHRELQLTEADLRDHVDEALTSLDEPLADPSFLPTSLVCKLARTEVTVCLSGDGGDELFGGYKRYTEALVDDAPRATGWRRALYRGTLQRLPLHAMKAWKLARRMRRALGTPEERYVARLLGLECALRARLLGPRARLVARAEAPEERLAAALAGPGDFAARMMALDLDTYLPGMILRKIDRASMLHSLEIRSPFLDHRLVEWAATVPVEHKLVGGDRKRLVRRSLEGRVPPALLERGKRGFGTPLGRWFRHELRDYAADHLDRSRLAADGYLDGDAVRALLAAHAARRRNYGEALWTLLACEVWYRQYGV